MLVNLSGTMWGELPATTFTGDISLGAYKLKLTDGVLKTAGEGDGFSFRNAADSDPANIRVNTVYWNQNIYASTSPVSILPLAADGAYVQLQAWTGAVFFEIARLMSAADPYLQIGRDDTGVGTAAITDMLVLQAGAGTNNEAANFGLGISMKIGNAASQVEERASIDLKLLDATDASEDVELNVNLMIAGAAAAVAAAGAGAPAGVVPGAGVPAAVATAAFAASSAALASSSAFLIFSC